MARTSTILELSLTGAACVAGALVAALQGASLVLDGLVTANPARIWLLGGAALVAIIAGIGFCYAANSMQEARRAQMRLVRGATQGR